MRIEVKDSFVNRRGDLVIVKRPLNGGDASIHTVTAGSLRRLRNEITKIYHDAEQKPYRAFKKREDLADAETQQAIEDKYSFEEEWQQSNDSNLIDLKGN